MHQSWMSIDKQKIISKYSLWLLYTQIVPVIFELPNKIYKILSINYRIMSIMINVVIKRQKA
jgi:hypothetical protein